MTASSITSARIWSAAEREGRFGVVAIVACQEFQWVISRPQPLRDARAVASFEFFKEERRVGVYYFYILDPEFGPGFIKICTYFPYPAKVWLNGHEWAKRQAAARRDRATPRLRTGSRSCPEPDAAAGALRHPRPRARAGVLRPLDHPDPDAVHPRGSRRRLLVGALDAPGRGLPHARVRRPPPRPAVLRSAVADNIGIGRPEQVSLVFARQVRRPTRRPVHRPAIFTPGTEVRIDFRYKHSASSNTSKTAARCGSRP